MREGDEREREMREREGDERERFNYISVDTHLNMVC